MIFERESHLGIRKIDIAKEEKGQYYFAGRNLGKSLPPAVLKSWSEVAKGPAASSTNNKSCPAGTFTFTKKEKQTATIKGCMQGEAYGHYIGHLEKVRDYAKGL
ncbi:hypothetical protein D3C87_1175130 [compost metagenome]